MRSGSFAGRPAGASRPDLRAWGRTLQPIVTAFGLNAACAVWPAFLEGCVAERPVPSGVEGLSSMGYLPWGCSALCCLGLGMVTLQCMFSSALPPADRRSLPVVSGAGPGGWPGARLTI